MMKHFYSLKILLAAFCIFVFTTKMQAQCGSFLKKKCMPKVQPFTLSGEANITTLSSGQKTTLNLTFYAGQAYRILVCAQEQLGTVTFKVYDLQRNVVFDSRKNDFPDFWDFKVKNTQQLVVEVQVPESESTSSVLPSGCVLIMVGFKKG
jgi:hypothetical protein